MGRAGTGGKYPGLLGNPELKHEHTQHTAQDGASVYGFEASCISRLGAETHDYSFLRVQGKHLYVRGGSWNEVTESLHAPPLC